ncbi:hypothetical protein Pr1d_21330 [Bythopirellula goksoeyrii]|uniref:Uncharacterized protein n=1 Tax=Bythopirellula goksoeyrii TaxID=1400387 RepID=A0A5B9QD27_9BACT|nr:hypothetical protein Pr1d_21330 [Bythopirellula goksoeyrii]
MKYCVPRYRKNEWGLCVAQNATINKAGSRRNDGNDSTCLEEESKKDHRRLKFHAARPLRQNAFEQTLKVVI